MAIYREEVVYVDPTSANRHPDGRQDMLSASPLRSDAHGTAYGTIAVTYGADFGQGYTSNAGTTQAVCIKAGDELAVLAALGNRLRGLHQEEEATNGTLVTTVEKLRVLLMGLGLSAEQQEFLISGLTEALPTLELPL